jgi:uncharacterized protein YodC (DUF2158 family)
MAKKPSAKATVQPEPQPAPAKLPFIPGELVRLKSGGLRMVVEEFKQGPHGLLVKCVWHDCEGRGNGTVYSFASLEKVERGK